MIAKIKKLAGILELQRANIAIANSMFEVLATTDAVKSAISSFWARAMFIEGDWTGKQLPPENIMRMSAADADYIRIVMNFMSNLQPLEQSLMHYSRCRKHRWWGYVELAWECLTKNSFLRPGGQDVMLEANEHLCERAEEFGRLLSVGMQRMSEILRLADENPAYKIPSINDVRMATAMAGVILDKTGLADEDAITVMSISQKDVESAGVTQGQLEEFAHIVQQIKLSGQQERFVRMLAEAHKERRLGEFVQAVLSGDWLEDRE